MAIILSREELFHFDACWRDLLINTLTSPLSSQTVHKSSSQMYNSQRKYIYSVCDEGILKRHIKLNWTFIKNNLLLHSEENNSYEELDISIIIHRYVLQYILWLGKEKFR